jgi:DNA-binding LacI/PurR family transcriptional regulator
MGEIAVRLLLQRLDTPQMPPERVVVQTELVVRGSSAPPRFN